MCVCGVSVFVVLTSTNFLQIKKTTHKKPKKSNSVIKNLSFTLILTETKEKKKLKKRNEKERVRDRIIII